MKILFVFCIAFFAIVIISLGIGIGEASSECEYVEYRAEVLSVYFTPRSFGVEESFRGKAIITTEGEYKNSVVEYDYHLGGTVNVGDTIISRRGCGYINQPF